jgi:AcrR family transcriptional regulator
MAAKKRRTTSGRKAAGARNLSSEDRLIDAALALAEAKGWNAVTLADIAARAGLSLGALYPLFRSKSAILDAFMRRNDQQTLANVEPARGDGESVRDRLFELFMRRLDVLGPHKRAVAAIAGDLSRDPVALLCNGARLMRSIAWMASAAGVDTTGLFGPLRGAGGHLRLCPARLAGG